MSESAVEINFFFSSAVVQNRCSGYTTSGRSGGQGYAGMQPERRFRGQDQAGASVELSPSS
ncbi:MAG TPA: hypothetical protein VHU83_01935, partial [Bryobacteraceae bacterium]|nr:hypothetical protein [Bryobacteraceae bacterium]